MQGLSLLTLYDPKHFIRHYLSRILELSQLDCLMRCWNYLVKKFWLFLINNQGQGFGFPFFFFFFSRNVYFSEENKFHQNIEIKTYNYEMHYLENCHKISNFCPKTNLEP